jgi:hypothetical protein
MITSGRQSLNHFSILFVRLLILEIVNEGYGFSGNAQYLGEKTVSSPCSNIAGALATPLNVERPVS